MRPHVCMHILRYGLPLCGFTRAVPKDWPEGHLWLGLNDDRAGCTMCDECLLRAEGFRSCVRRHWLVVLQHIGTGKYVIRLPTVVLVWGRSTWWHVGLMKFWRWEFGP